MGPMFALVQLAARRGLQPFHELIVSTERNPLVALHVELDGSARLEMMPPGAFAMGMRLWSRTGVTVEPRAFRDNAKYSIEPGKFRDGYAALVERMLAAHPQSRPLQALVNYLRSSNVPTLVARDKAMEKALLRAQYIPHYKGRPVIDAIIEDLVGARSDPYGPPNTNLERPDVITGEICQPSVRKPVRIRGLGDSTGLTFISVDDLVTASRWSSAPMLQVPVSQYTMTMHVAGAQSLLDEREPPREGKDIGPPKWLQAAKRGSDKLVYLVWCARADGSESVVLDVLKGRAQLEDVEAWAAKATVSDDYLCVLGISGNRRLAIQAWSCLPLREAAQNILAFARTCSLKSGRVMGLGRLKALTVPAHLCEDNPMDAYELSDSHLDWQSVSAIVDHIIEGHPFPWLLRERIRAAFLSQDKLSNAHTSMQMSMLSALT